MKKIRNFMKKSKKLVMNKRRKRKFKINFKIRTKVRNFLRENCRKLIRIFRKLMNK